MEKNNTSNSSMCKKIRQALATNPALRAIHRISSYHQQPKPVTTDSNSPISSPTNTSIQTKPPLPQQHHKINTTEGPGPITINFDYSTPKTKVASPNVDGNSDRATKVAAKGEPQKSIDINDTFNEYIKRAKEKIRTVSNIGRGQNNNPVLDHEAHGANKKEDHKDHFSDFIHHAKKKFRTTTIVGNTSSSKRG